VFLHVLSDGTIYADQRKRPDRKTKIIPKGNLITIHKKGMKESKKEMPLIQMEDQEIKEHDEIR
jgi:hypothetical protein